MTDEMLDLYSDSDYLRSACGTTTADGLNHDQVTRFLSGQVRTSAELWRAVMPLEHQCESEQGVLIFDDSIEEKPYTDENDIVCWHYDPTQGRNVKGINFLTVLYHSQRVSQLVGLYLVAKTESYLDAKSGKVIRCSPTTKNDYYREMIQACVHGGLPFRYVLNDSRYASADNMMLVRHELGRHFVMALKSNCRVEGATFDKAQGRYQPLSTLNLPEGMVREVYLESVDFPLLLTQQLFTSRDGSAGLRYWVTSDLTLCNSELTSLYQTRWQVEEHYHSLNHSSALDRSPTHLDHDHPYQPLLCGTLSLH
jgi:hypothetical protein